MCLIRFPENMFTIVFCIQGKKKKPIDILFWIKLSLKIDQSRNSEANKQEMASILRSQKERIMFI